MAQKQWAGTTYGSGGLHKSLIWTLRFIDVRLLYLFASIFVVPVCLILNDSRRTAYRYFRDRHGYGRIRAAWATYINHCKFAQVVIDKFAMYAGKKFEVEVIGMDRFNELASKDEGFLHLSSHIGNYEIAGYTLVSERKTINAVVYAHEKASVMENRNNMFTKTNIRMITLRQDMSHLFEIDQALCNGDIVSFPTDRFMGQAKCVECTFLGKTAKFPQGPFSVATMRGLDVLAVNVMKIGLVKYRIYVTPLQYDKEAPRREQLRQLSQAYVAELEKRVLEYPEQWYNFFDFWN
mgnify:FL=1